MTTERLTPTDATVGTRGAIVRRSRTVIALAVAMLVIFAGSAAAETVTATATCGSATFYWASFNSAGSGNGELNTPAWTVVFTPASGATLVIQGTASFAGSTSSLTVPLPSADGIATASSSWSRAETHDRNATSGSTSLTIANCPATAVAPATGPAGTAVVTEVTGAAHPVATANVPGVLALSTNGSAAPTSGGTIRDTAVLSGGSSPTGKIAFSLYSASDTSCSSVLRTVSVAVRGDGSYLSPAITPASGGAYQWVASYSGDKRNRSLSGSCNDPTERSTFAEIDCSSSPVALHGVPQTVTKSLSAYVAAPGVKSVTFYLDGRNLKTLARPSNRRFSISVAARTLSYGVHWLMVAVATDRSSCANEAAATFIHVKS